MARSEQPDFALFLNRLTRRSALSTEERAAILALPSQTAQIQANRDLVRLGEPVDHATLIVEGVVGQFGQTPEGERQIMALFVGGDMADLYSMMRSSQGTGLQALSTTTVLRVPHVALRSLARRYPAIAEAFWRDCVVDASILAEWVLNVGRRNARTRLAHLICEMAVRYGYGGRPRLEFSLPVTQTHLADATGMTPVHVNRTLRDLRQEGIVEVRLGEVKILSWGRLVGAGEFDAAYLEADATRH